MPTSDIKKRLVKKGNAHDIIMSKIKKIYKMDKMNVMELGRLCDISYYRLRRLLFVKDGSKWTADEWFKVMIVCSADGAIPQMYKSTRRDLAKYQQSAKYQKQLPKTPGPLKGYRDKEVKYHFDDEIEDESFDL